jgi:hypothetical protein
MTDTTALDAAVRLYLPWVRANGLLLTEDSVSTALIRTAYWRMVREHTQCNTAPLSTSAKDGSTLNIPSSALSP